MERWCIHKVYGLWTSYSIEVWISKKINRLCLGESVAALLYNETYPSSVFSSIKEKTKKQKTLSWFTQKEWLKWIKIKRSPPVAAECTTTLHFSVWSSSHTCCLHPCTAAWNFPERGHASVHMSTTFTPDFWQTFPVSSAVNWIFCWFTRENSQAKSCVPVSTKGNLINQWEER